MKLSKILFALVFGAAMLVSNVGITQHENDNHDGHEHATHEEGADHHKKFSAKETAFHHIADANVYSTGWANFPLPCFLYDTDRAKWSIFSSSKFHIHGHHGDGTDIVDGYVLNGGTGMKIANPSPEMLSEDHISIASQDAHPFKYEAITVEGKEKEVSYFMHNGERFDLIKKTTLDGGVFGGGVTSFYDFSITKNVASMILVCLFMMLAFFSIAKAYKTRDGKAPSGLQAFMEPIIVFIQDEVAKPFLGDSWKKFLPFLLTIFFFILGLNLFGQIPFLGGSNVTGNLSVTFVLAIAAFFVVNLSGNKHYWEHIVWMPGVPALLKLILTPVELLGVFIKPITLMLRLFANITAGHMVMVIFVSLIFIAKDMGGEGIAWGTSIASILLTMFMMSIELLVAFIQAFVFTILTAAYLNAAIDEGHDHDHDDAHAHAH